MSITVWQGGFLYTYRKVSWQSRISHLVETGWKYPRKTGRDKFLKYIVCVSIGSQGTLAKQDIFARWEHVYRSLINNAICHFLMCSNTTALSISWKDIENL